MKQGNVLFIIIVVAAAMVLGTTFGIVNSYKHIANAQKALVKQSGSKTDQTKDTTEISEPTSTPTDKESSISSSEETKVSSVDDSGNFTVLSPTETRDIQHMLASLGHSDPQLKASVSSFQSANKIKATGVLDNTTLETVIQQFTLQKAQAIVY
ncbi:MAG: peptidoglycan-binding domain-containing protein [Ignavibacteriales bacterium]